jgi:amino-acid racemase
MTALAQLGLLGGMSWESTAVYYRLLNELVHRRVGGHASAPVLVWSVDFAEIEALQRSGDWAEQGRILGDAAAALQDAGVQAVALATNTLHLVADDITARIDVDFIDLIDVVARSVTSHGYRTVGVLATGFTMDSGLYPARLGQHGVNVITPEGADHHDVHRIIYDELVHGIVRDESRARYLEVITHLVERGAQAVLLACTEITLLLADGDADVPLLDTTGLHCLALADFMMSGVAA